VFFWLILLLLTFVGGVYLAIAFLVLVILLAVLQWLT